MEIQKIFSEQDSGERLYSVLMSDEELKLFTKWDMTDQYKGMKDSDILAERRRSNARSYINSAKAGVIGAGVGAVGGALLKKKLRMKAMDAAKMGSLVGGALGLSGGLATTHQEREENRFANRRLQEMKYQARRRESKDWRSQTNYREGYTY